MLYCQHLKKTLGKHLITEISTTLQSIKNRDTTKIELSFLERFVVTPPIFLAIRYPVLKLPRNKKIKAKQFLTNLSNLEEKDSLSDIFLVGKVWLGLDEDDFLKIDGNLYLINFKGRLFKVFFKIKHLKEYLENQDTSPHSLFFSNNLRLLAKFRK